MFTSSSCLKIVRAKAYCAKGWKGTGPHALMVKSFLAKLITKQLKQHVKQQANVRRHGTS